MARLTTATRTVYYAPTRRRAYLTKDAAAYAEARAMITRKYPIEGRVTENGFVVDSGWHWTEDDRLCKVYARLARILRRAM